MVPHRTRDACGLVMHTQMVVSLIVATSSASASFPGTIFDERIRDIIRSELLRFRDEMREIFKKDIEKISKDVKEISDRVEVLEKRIASVSQTEENICEKIMERERKSRNVLLYNVEESDAGALDAPYDFDKAKVVISRIIPHKNVNILNVNRLGGSRPGRIRPLCIVLGSRNEVIDVKKNKHNLAGDIRVSPSVLLGPY